MALTESIAVTILGWPGPVHQSCPSSCRRAPAILKIPKNPAYPASDHPPNIVAKKITAHLHNPLNHSSDKRPYKPTCDSSSPAILKIPNYPANPASDHPPNIVAKKITAHLHNPLNHSSDKRSYKPICTSSSPANLKIPINPANPASDHPPNIVAKKITAHPHNPINHSSDKRSYERTCASSSPAIMKIPINPANPASDNPPNIVAKKITDHPHNPLNHSSDNRSYKPTCASSSPAILKIPNYPANPASDNPPIIAFMKITAHPHNPLNHSSDKRSYKHTCAGRTRPLFSKLTNMPFSFRMT